MTGKMIRLSRIKDPDSQRFFIVPMDHGFSTWPLRGLENMEAAVRRVAVPGVTAVLVHKGHVRQAAPVLAEGRGPGLIVHLSGATSLGPDEHDKRLVGSVEHALRTGADAVSVHVNLGCPGEPGMIADLARVAEECHAWGMPLLAMMYARGSVDPNDWKPVAHAVRIAAELGADIVKTSYTGCVDSFQRVVEGAGIPVLVSGGPNVQSDALLVEAIHEARLAGASGACIGRNIFQHPHPAKVLQLIANMIHEEIGTSVAGD
jgi:predicted phospho-2-dehydro-3-deoxyheptonate aldolase